MLGVAAGTILSTQSIPYPLLGLNGAFLLIDIFLNASYIAKYISLMGVGSYYIVSMTNQKMLPVVKQVEAEEEEAEEAEVEEAEEMEEPSESLELMAIDILTNNEISAEIQKLCASAEGPHKSAVRGFGTYYFRSDPRIKQHIVAMTNPIQVDVRNVAFSHEFDNKEDERIMPYCPERVIAWLLKNQQARVTLLQQEEEEEEEEEVLPPLPLSPLETEYDDDDMPPLIPVISLYNTIQ